MGKHEKKTAKGEQGFRSRAAFKLVQLNKKFHFLENARCCIDLCAAPGGWLQVASKNMPPNSLIVGVDLVPIKPIPRCTTFAEDINSFRCRDKLRELLKDWKADCVLHDGAPNVGTAWVQDAYAQNELTLQSLRLAVEFLRPGGTFVTKVFRSKDYNNLMWVFNQLFHHVEATKPPSSRNVSAEIFVVCERFKNLARIDPKFLDPRYVFKELEPQQAGEMTGTSAHNALENVINPEKARRKREGYEEGNYTLYKTISAHDYINAPDAIAVLGTHNRITFTTDDDKKIKELPETSADVVANCEDLKLLGRREFSTLIKWRKKARDTLGLDRKAAPEPTATIDVEPLDEEEAIDEELSRLNEEADRRARKERRRRNETRAKTLQKLQLNMTTPMELGEEWKNEALDGEDVYVLDDGAQAQKAYDASRDDQDIELEDDADAGAAANDASDDDASDTERRLAELETGIESMYEQYQTHLQERDAKWRAKEARRKSGKYEEWTGIGEEAPVSEDDESDGGYDVMERRKFAEETYDSDDAQDDEDERVEVEANAQPKAKKAAARAPRPALPTTLPKTKESATSAIWFDNPLFRDMAAPDALVKKPRSSASAKAQPTGKAALDELDDEESDQEDDSEDDIEIVPRGEADVPDGAWSVYGEDVEAKKQERIKQYGLHTAQAVTMAQALVNKQKTKTDLIDEGFNRHTFTDKSDLPSWFLDDEQKYYRDNVPVTKEAVAALRAKQRALDARPIKKIAEAKARKKYKAAKRLENAQKRAEAINENSELSEREKAESINRVLARSMKKTQKPEVKLVVARGVNRGIKGRPKGTKGRYRMVDTRMKKELRAQKRIAQRDGKKRSSGNGGKKRIPKGY
ncbi:AdoMet-dependent rRNA methyltransferase spb1 [Malassezia cuniculi]|uniref:AdoMet-dependent rRNA methyltransferase spb1 n=1 Tax=Malassezia cuniculi TaxID=948313 RepID=A0AAF0ENQ6_9BASI|nr:AdoMet-dependent rRNA methyltransferase spb1 [Malassezia cuniculi]